MLKLRLDLPTSTRPLSAPDTDRSGFMQNAGNAETFVFCKMLRANGTESAAGY
jgi:hypothetical protein